jgi:hypothetical protein
MTRNQEIAAVIVQQLGGMGRLCAMTGAKDFVAIENGVSFGIGKNAKGVNKVRIVLTAQDLYDVEFGAVRTVKLMPTYKVKSSTEGVYCDMLKAAFEAATGMYLTL